jgi:hypothetical protein
MAVTGQRPINKRRTIILYEQLIRQNLEFSSCEKLFSEISELFGNPEDLERSPLEVVTKTTPTEDCNRPRRLRVSYSEMISARKRQRLLHSCSYKNKQTKNKLRGP